MSIHTYLVHGDPCRRAFQNLSHKRQVLESGIIVVEIQEVHKDCGTAGGLQRGSAAWKHKEAESDGEREVYTDPPHPTPLVTCEEVA